MLFQLNYPKFPLLASLAAVAVTGLFGGSTPANAASITYNRWLNIGPQKIGDEDNGKFTLKITGNIGNSTQTDPQYDPQLEGKVLFQFSAVSLPSNLRISEVYFNINNDLFSGTPVTTGNGNNQTTTMVYDAWVSPAHSIAVDELNFVYSNNTLPQGSSIQVNSGNLSKPSFSFDSKGNVDPIKTGETLGILVELGTGKTFINVLESLTKNSDLLVAAHIVGYNSGGSLSDGFYYGRADGVNSGTESALTAGPNGTPLYYDEYGTTEDPNPATKATTPPPPPGTAVPEPLTMLGAATAASLGAAFKRRLRKAAK